MKVFELSLRRIAPLVLLCCLVCIGSSSLYAQTAPVPCASGTYVYVNNNVDGPNSVSAFCVGSGGTLTAVVGSPFLTGGTGNGFAYYGSNGIAASVVGNFLYASDTESNDIAAFSINTSTGVLSPVSGSPFVYGEEESNTGGISLAITPNGQILYAGDTGTGDIWGFSITQSGENAGALTALTPAAGVAPPLYTFASPVVPDGINVTRDGNYLAVALVGELAVAMFQIQSGGTLVPVANSPFAAPGTEGSANGTAFVEINCASNLAFASLYSDALADVSVLNIANGALSPISPPPSNFTFSTPTSNNVDSNVGVLSPNDNFLFVSNQLSNTIMSLSVAPSGGVAPTGAPVPQGSLSQVVAGSPFCNSSNSENCNGEVNPSVPVLMATNQAGTLLFVANYNYPVDDETVADNTVTVYTIGSGNSAGVLTFVSAYDTLGAGQPSLTAFPPKACSALGVSKTAAVATVNYGNPIGFTVTMSNAATTAQGAATGTATTVTLSDPLPTGPSWSITTPVTGCQTTGELGSQTLSCSLSNLASGSSASVTVTGTGAVVGAYPNTATVTANNSPPVSSSATVTVDPAITAISNVMQSQTTIPVGTSSITLSGTISAPGPNGALYPPTTPAEMVTVSINGGTQSPQSAAIGANGIFSLTFLTNTLPVSTAPYTITCSYATDGNFASVTSTCGSLAVTQPVVISYTLNVAPQGLGAGTVTDSTGKIIDCAFAYPSVPPGPSCSASYASGTPVTLIATPNSPSTTFGGWGPAGSACASFGTNPMCSFTITSTQNITASFPLPPTVTTVQFTPGSNVTQMVQYCPNNNCSDLNASAFTAMVPTVLQAFPLTIVQYETDPNGLCPANQVSLGGLSTDFDCRFVSFFNYGIDSATGGTIVPLCYPYLNGDCVHYYLYSGTPGMQPPPGSLNGGFYLKIGWNNVFAPPAGSYWAGSTPSMLDDPGANEFPPLPYGDICSASTPMLVGTPGVPYLNPQGQQIYCQFDENITTFFTPGPGLDPIAGHIPATNDVAVAFLPTSTGTGAVQQPPKATAPTITVSCVSGCATSGSSITFNQGTPGTFVVSATGSPAATLTETGALPSGLTFNPITGWISGTPAAGTGGTSYPITITASNGVSPSATKNFTLTVSSLEISPPIVNFGTVDLGQIAGQFVTVTNNGTTPLMLSKATITTPGSAPGDYYVLDLCPPLISAMPGALPAGKSCKIGVGLFATAKIFSPTASTATLALTVAGVQQSVLLTALVINPQVSLSSISLNFGTEKTGTPSAPKEVTLSNSGSTPLQLTGLKINQPISGNFALTSGAGTNCMSLPTLSPGAACSIYVTFTPTSKGPKTGSVIITDDTLFGAQAILLTGTGD
jgi:large repetitive protein